MQETRQKTAAIEAKQTQPWKPSHDIGDLSRKVMESLKGVAKRRATSSHYSRTVISLTFSFHQMIKLEKSVLVLSKEFLFLIPKFSLVCNKSLCLHRGEKNFTVIWR